VIGVEFAVNSLGLLPVNAFLWADIVVLGDRVGESEEFTSANFADILFVDFLASRFNPIPILFSNGVVVMMGKSLETNLDFIIREGTVVVGIDIIVGLVGFIPSDAYSISWFFWFSVWADLEVFGDIVGKFVEFFFVN
jgi:hypothetical protein